METDPYPKISELETHMIAYLSLPTVLHRKTEFIQISLRFFPDVKTDAINFLENGSFSVGLHKDKAERHRTVSAIDDHLKAIKEKGHEFHRIWQHWESFGKYYKEDLDKRPHAQVVRPSNMPADTPDPEYMEAAYLATRSQEKRSETHQPKRPVYHNQKHKFILNLNSLHAEWLAQPHIAPT
ncbi:MAG: hypothetical protein Q9170_002035 [Blastenia crenularia]